MERPYHPLTWESDFRRLIRKIGVIFFYPILWLVFFPLYRLRVTGGKHLAIPGGVVSVMNHCVHIEWFFVWHAARPRNPFFTAEEANMRRLDAGWFNWIMGVIGIPADNPMAIAPAVRYALENGELVHFFPEGVLKPGNRCPEGFMIGAAWFACRHNVPLIPISEILKTGALSRILPWWPPQVHLIVGEPLYPADFEKTGERMRYRATRMTDEAERIIRETIQAAGKR